MSACICGSVAFDTIMEFDGRFGDHILPDKVHILNVSFLVPAMKREFGGCAGNIAYALKQLGGDPRIVAAVGNDSPVYLERLRGLGISTDAIRVVPETYTAQAFITTDDANNQITAFHPGAMMQSHLAPVSAAGPVRIGIIAPDGKDGMLIHARQMRDAGIPFIFDPGQALPIFSGPELLELIGMADWLAVNDYEGQLVAEKTGKPLAELSRHLRAVIVTRGQHGVELIQSGEVTAVHAMRASDVIDPTGCGDAFRGGLLFGLIQGMSLEESVQIGAVMGALKIAHPGGQNYCTSWDEVRALIATHYPTA
ncbi:sugar kinase [beta proteobacterium AAP99]|nr:sugar kinase [beta proteobacterium AAP99]